MNRIFIILLTVCVIITSFILYLCQNHYDSKIKSVESIFTDNHVNVANYYNANEQSDYQDIIELIRDYYQHNKFPLAYFEGNSEYSKIKILYDDIVLKKSLIDTNKLDSVITITANLAIYENKYDDSFSCANNNDKHADTLNCVNQLHAIFTAYKLYTYHFLTTNNKNKASDGIALINKVIEYTNVKPINIYYPLYSEMTSDVKFALEAENKITPINSEYTNYKRMNLVISLNTNKMIVAQYNYLIDYCVASEYKFAPLCRLKYAKEASRLLDRNISESGCLNQEIIKSMNRSRYVHIYEKYQEYYNVACMTP